MDIEKEMLKGYIDIIILSMLYERDLYGYELGKRVKEETQNRFEMKEGTLYLAFKRMEQNRLISSYWGDESVGGRRRYYRIMPEGKAYVRARKADWENLKEIVDLFLKGVKDDGQP